MACQGRFGAVYVEVVTERFAGQQTIERIVQRAGPFCAQYLVYINI